MSTYFFTNWTVSKNGQIKRTLVFKIHIPANVFLIRAFQKFMSQLKTSFYDFNIWGNQRFKIIKTRLV